MKNPVDKQRREYLLAAERKLGEIVPVLQKLAKCGTDVDERMTLCTELYDRIQAYKVEFMPDAIKQPRTV